MIFADTSDWVEFDRATGSGVDQRLVSLIASGADLAVTEPVVMELAAGAKTGARENDLRRMVTAFQLRRFEAASDFDAAVKIYRRCRSAGITPRGLTDCMIAAVTWRFGDALLAHDADLARIADTIGIDLDPASLHV